MCKINAREVHCLHIDELPQILRYDPELGLLFWRERPSYLFASPADARKWNARFAGKEAFMTIDADGYRMGRIFGRAYKAHRVIWAIVTGKWPDDEIDHISGSKSDNRFGNLREATHAQNIRNRGLQSNNTSGFKGVYWSKQYKKWRVRIKVDGRFKHLGAFDEIEAAAAAYSSASEKYFGHFARGAL